MSVPSKKLTVVLVVLAALGGVLFFSFDRFVNSDRVRGIILHRASQKTGYPLSAKAFSLGLFKGPYLTAHDIEAPLPGGAGSLHISRIDLFLDPADLLKGEVVVKEVLAVGPRLELAPPKQERGTEAKGLPDPVPGPRLSERILEVVKELPTITTQGASISVAGMGIRLRDLSLTFRPGKGQTREVTVSGKGEVLTKDRGIPFALQGTLSRTEPQGVSRVELSVETGAVPLAGLLLSGPFSFEGGTVSVRAQASGDPDQGLSFQGAARMEAPLMRLQKRQRQKAFSFPDLDLTFRGTIGRSFLTLSSFALKGSSFLLQGDMGLTWGKPGDPRMALAVHGPEMPVETFLSLLPTPLFSGWLDEVLFPMLSGGTVSLGNFSLKGSLSAIEDLDRPENGEVLGMSLAFKGLGLRPDTREAVLEHLRGDIAIAKGRLHLSGLTGESARSLLREGYLEVADLFVPDPCTFAFGLKGAFSLAELWKQGALFGLQDLLKKGPLSGISGLSGILDTSLRGAYRKGELEIHEADFRMKEGLVEGGVLFHPLGVEGEGTMGPEGPLVLEGSGRWGRSPFTVKGQVERGLARLALELEGGLDMRDLGPLLSPKTPDLLTAKGPLPFQGRVTKGPERWAATGDLGLDGVVFTRGNLRLSPPGEGNRASGAVEMEPSGRLVVQGAELSLGALLVRSLEPFSPGGRETLHMAVRALGLSLADSGIRVLDTGGALEGSATCDLRLRICPSALEETTLDGDLALTGLSLTLPTLPCRVTGGDMQARFQENKVVLERCSMRIGESLVRLEGELEKLFPPRGNLALKAHYLDLGSCLLLLPTEGFSGGPGFSGEPELGLTLEAARGDWGGFEFGPLKAVIHMGPGLLSLQGLQSGLEHGSMSLRGHIRQRPTPEILFSTHIKLDKQPLSRLPPVLDALRAYCDGPLTLETLIGGKGKDKQDLLSHMTGSFNFLIEKGVIRKSTVLLKVMEFMSIKGLFKRKPPDLAREGLYFEELRGHVTIRDGHLETEEVDMKSPVLNAGVRGRVDLLTETMDLDLSTEPLGTLDSLLSGIPVVGYILTGEDRSIYLICFKATGPVGKPEVVHVPFKGVGTSTAGVFTRLLGTPLRFFGGLTDAVEGLTRQGIPLPDEGPEMRSSERGFER